MEKLTRRQVLARCIAASGATLLGAPLLGPARCLAQRGGGGGRRQPVRVNADNPSIVWDQRSCRGCGACHEMCSRTMTVAGYYDPSRTGGRAVCIQCGQCTTACKHLALYERPHYPDVSEHLASEEVVLVATTSPAVRVALGEYFNLRPGENFEGRMVAALRGLGFDYVLDTTFAADLTVMEETTELVERITRDRRPDMPLFTSCCPAWVSFAEIFYPELLPHLSSAKSPILMQGAMVKTYFAAKHGLDPSRIVNVAIAPCTAKKFEILRPEMNAAARFHGLDGARDMDYVLTTREMGRMVTLERMAFDRLPESDFDSFMGKGSGAGVIFGATGGVTEAALRTAWWQVTGEQPPRILLQFTPVRGLAGVREAELDVGGRTVRVAVVHGTGHVRGLVARLKSGAARYDFVEVMACPGGCIGGGGQPRPAGRQAPNDTLRAQRIAGLYRNDSQMSVRLSHENPAIQAIYREFLGEPASERATSLLHTAYRSRAHVLGG